MNHIRETLQLHGVFTPIEETTPVNSLGLDSLDFLALLVDLDIEDAKQAAECQTIGELALLIPA